MLEWFKKRYCRKKKYTNFVDLDFDAAEVSHYIALFSIVLLLPILVLIYEAPRLQLGSFQSDPQFYMIIFGGMLLMNITAETTSYLDDTKWGKTAKSIIFYIISLVIFTYPLIKFQQYINTRDLSICAVSSFVIAYLIAPRMNKEMIIRKITDIKNKFDIDRLIVDFHVVLILLAPLGMFGMLLYLILH